jgi:mRNA degradation ribonuclease J1/J2
LLVSTDSEALRERRRLMHNGMIVVVIVAGSDRPDVRVSVHGLAAEPGENLGDDIGAEIEDQIARAPRGRRTDPVDLETFARRAINRVVRSISQKRPLVDVQVILPAAPTRSRRQKEVVQ